MPWAVTLQITDCSSPSTNLAFATIYDGINYFSADANGQFIAVIPDIYTGYVVQVSKASYITKPFTFHTSQQGKVQAHCLNPVTTPPGGGGGGGSPSCFIVTAATGSAQSAEVNGLRQLRDRVGGVSRLGAQLIEAIYREYAQFSPAIAADLEQDTVSRQAVLWVVVRPLVAWYSLAGKLGLERDEESVRAAVQQVAEACPRYLSPASIASMLEVVRSGRELPETAPDLLREFAPKIADAARFPFASWGILEPLVRVWTAAAEGRDVVEEVAQWLAGAPIDSFLIPASPQQLESELEVLSGIMAFHPAARRQLGERLLAAWPHARPALERTAFI